jgi:hypothetical protein
MENAQDLNLDSAIAMAQDETPQLGPTPRLNYTLPGGFLDDDGMVHTTVTVRELTGADEEALEAPLKASTGKINPYDFYEQAIKRATVRIGTVTTIDDDIVHRLLIGDRDYLMVCIRRATYGDILEGQVRCPSCGNSSDVTINLEDDTDVEVKRLADGNKRTFTVPLRRGTAEVRLATGGDQHELGEDMNRSLAEMNTLLLSKCVVSINGQSIYESALEPEEMVRSLGSADRRTLLNFLAENQPGPKLREVKVPCATCGVQVDAPIDMATLLRG